MFKEKYIRDNESIQPREEILTALAKKMNDYQAANEHPQNSSLYESHIPPDQKNLKYSSSGQRFKLYSTIAASLCILIISIATLTNINIVSNKDTSYQTSESSSETSYEEAPNIADSGSSLAGGSLDTESEAEAIAEEPEFSLHSEADEASAPEESAKQDSDEIQYEENGAANNTSINTIDISEIQSVSIESFESSTDIGQKILSIPLDETLISVLQEINIAETSNDTVSDINSNNYGSEKIYLLYFTLGNDSELKLKLCSDGHVSWDDSGIYYKIDEVTVKNFLETLDN